MPMSAVNSLIDEVGDAFRKGTTESRSRALRQITDLFIAATAIANNLPCATLNKKHFERIEELKIID